MILEHFTAEPLKLSRPRRYKQAVEMKPSGLWVSVKGEDDWPHWVENEQFGLDRFDYVNTIELRENTNVLVLDSVDAIVEFNNKYAKVEFSSAYYIDWRLVSDHYDGIIIAPYQWSLRLETRFLWYYGWDVASGCIWNLDAIKSVSTKEHKRELERTN